jgi:hypothetical protein
MIEIIKIIYRLLRYKAEWKKQWREFSIKRSQNKLIYQNFNTDTETLIVFLTVGANYDSGKADISGGMISIISLAEESQILFQSEGPEVVCCTKNKDHLVLKFSNFENKTTIFRFSQLKSNFKKSKKIIVHIPELMVADFFEQITGKDAKWLEKHNEIHFNILNQNIKLMPEKSIVDGLKAFANTVTITTAHQQYCTQEMSNYYEVPIHKFSVWISPEKYEFKKWEEKENIIAFSPDYYINLEKIEIEIKRRFPNYTIVTINNLTYTDYKKLILKSKFVITFGEGLDAYFIEPIFSGSISFAVYNEKFFTPDYLSLDNIFSSYQDLETNLLYKISQYDSSAYYESVNSVAYNLCANHYSYNVYKKNIELFYKGEYTFEYFFK